MKKWMIILFVFTMPAAMVMSQPFEGKITYRNTYKSKLPTVTDDQLESMMGNVQQFYIKDGSFKSMANGRFVEWQLYINSENRLYNKLSSTDTVFWINAALPGDTIVSTEIKKDAETILGYRCDALILKGKTGTQTYYYNAAIAANPVAFSKFTFGNWYDFIARAKALPLKVVLDATQYTLERVALEVSPGKLDTSMFTLPIDAYTMETPME